MLVEMESGSKETAVTITSLMNVKQVISAIVEAAKLEEDPRWAIVERFTDFGIGESVVP